MKHGFAPSALLLALLAPLSAMSEISVAINIGPPPLPVYVQPPVPGNGYLWTPGYWGWSGPENDYYWVPGTWVLPPTVGVLWTPGYWGFYGGGYRWRTGYWGPRVGFYGGIAYGHGYTGNGYQGGRWERGAFHYNTSVNNVDKVIVRNVYNTTIVNNYNVKRVSFNGGPDGIKAEPTAKERKEQQAKHVDPTPNQVQHERTAMATPSQKASVNRGSPPVGATSKPSEFDGQDKNRGNDEDSKAVKKSGADDTSPAQKNAGTERKQAQAADPPQGRREQRQGGEPATKQPDAAAPAPRDPSAKRARRDESQVQTQPPQDGTDARPEQQAKPKNESARAQRKAEQQQQSQQQSQQQPQQPQQPEQQQQPKAQGKPQGEDGKEKGPGRN